MKTIKLIIGLQFVVFMLNAQISLNYETHALQADYEYTTQYIENISPGLAGANQIWNFSDFECGITKNSEILLTSDCPQELQNPTNIAVKDNGNYFYFNIDESGIEYNGLISENAIINLDQPVVKMNYPFTYGDLIEGDFLGNGLYRGRIETIIYGTYSVEADGFGTLILPGNVTIDNVLRVKTINTTFEVTCNTTEFKNVKYLWYSADYRYPIMVVTLNDKIIAGKTTTSNYGYYNEKAFQTSLQESNNETANYSLNVFPNPSTDYVNINYNLPQKTNVNIEIFDITGNKVASVVNNQEQEGTQTQTFYPELSVGTYFIKMNFGKNTIFRRIVLVE